jgi:hypothetical protein
MIPVCIFTYAGDSLPIRECVRSVINAGLFPVVCDDAADSLSRDVVAMLEDAGAEYVLTTFERRGNLNGTDTAAGIARTLHEACGRYGTSCAIKLDSDTILIDPTQFLNGNVGVHSTVQNRRAAFGCVYSLAAETALCVAKELEFGHFDPTAPEDLAIWDAVAALNHQRTMHDFNPDHGAFASVPIGSDPVDCIRFAALTFGNVPDGGWTDRPFQIMQEMRRFNQHLEKLSQG